MRTICICLPEREQDIANAKAHFEEVGVGPVEFIWGINAEVAGLATWHPYERDAPGSGFKMGAKPTGIWLAHIIAWTVAMQFTDEHIMILETDAKFLPGWKAQLEEAIRVLPVNYDFLHPGSCCMEGHPKKWVEGNVWETKHAQCTHCYIVRRAVLPFMLRTIRKCFAPIDIQMQLECFPHLKTYAIVPRIVEQFNTILPP